MGRISKIKREMIEESNKRILGEQSYINIMMKSVDDLTKELETEIPRKNDSYKVPGIQVTDKVNKLKDELKSSLEKAEGDIKHQEEVEVLRNLIARTEALLKKTEEKSLNESTIEYEDEQWLVIDNEDEDEGEDEGESEIEDEDEQSLNEQDLGFYYYDTEKNQWVDNPNVGPYDELKAGIVKVSKEAKGIVNAISQEIDIIKDGLKDKAEIVKIGGAYNLGKTIISDMGKELHKILQQNNPQKNIPHTTRDDRTGEGWIDQKAVGRIKEDLKWLLSKAKDLVSKMDKPQMEEGIIKEIKKELLGETTQSYETEEEGVGAPVNDMVEEQGSLDTNKEYDIKDKSGKVVGTYLKSRKPFAFKANPGTQYKDGNEIPEGLSYPSIKRDLSWENWDYEKHERDIPKPQRIRNIKETTGGSFAKYNITLED